MLREEKITDFYGHILGYITTDTITGNKTAYNFYRAILGRYDSNNDVTRDFYGKIVSRGDTTAALIYNYENNKQGK